MSTLDEMIVALRLLGDPKTVESRIAAKTAPIMLANLRATLGAGETPEGSKWAARKKGGRAYASAASRVTVDAYGPMIRVVLSGPEVYGHFGASGIIERQMIPSGGTKVPASVTDAIDEAATLVWQEAVGS